MPISFRTLDGRESHKSLSKSPPTFEISFQLSWVDISLPSVFVTDTNKKEIGGTLEIFIN